MQITAFPWFFARPTIAHLVAERRFAGCNLTENCCAKKKTFRVKIFIFFSDLNVYGISCGRHETDPVVGRNRDKTCENDSDTVA